MANDFKIVLQGELDKQKTSGNIKSSLAEISRDLSKNQNLEVTAHLSDRSLQNIQHQLDGISKGLKLDISNVNLGKINLNNANIQKQGQQIGQQLGQAVASNINNAINNSVTSFDKLQTHFNRLTGKAIDKNTGKPYEKLELSSLSGELNEQKQKLRAAFSEFGDVTIDPKINNGKIESFRVKLQQVNGDLKDTMTFTAKIGSDNGVEFEGLVKGSERLVQHLDQAKNSLQQFAQLRLPAIQENNSMGNYALEVENLRERYTKLGLELPQVSQQLRAVEHAQQSLDSVLTSGTASTEQIRDAFDHYQASLKNANKAVSKSSSMYMSATGVQNLIAQLEAFRQKNSAITGEAKKEIQGYINYLKNAGTVAKSEGSRIVSSLKQIEVGQRNLGRLGLNTFDTLKQGMQSFTQWLSATFIVMRGFQAVRGGISSIKDLDTALVDLRKTAKMTTEELNAFYYQSNDTAKQMGVTTEQIIEQAANWSRLGYATADAATQMAKYSSMFRMISPGMDINSATDGLVSVMKAFKIGEKDVSEVVDGIMSKINIIGNTKALSNSDIIEFLTRSSSAMSSANNSLEETIALGEAATEITRDASSVGQVLKTTSMRIRGRQSLPPYTVMYMLCS